MSTSGSAWGFVPRNRFLGILTNNIVWGGFASPNPATA
jgi:hypothetical protein